MAENRQLAPMSSSAFRSPVPLNEAEAIIEPFWDQYLSPLTEYTLASADGTKAVPAAAAQDRPTTVGIRPETPPMLGPVPPDKVRASQFWCWVTLAWDRPVPTATPAIRRRGRAGAGPARPVLSFCRDVQVDLSGYDRLVARVACPSHVQVSLVATVDGVEQTIINGQPGRGKAHEFEGRVRGHVLERICLKIASTRDGADEAWLYWIGCANKRARTTMLARSTGFTPEWKGWLRPEGSAVELAPRFGFFFDGAELDALRQKALSPLYQPIMDQLRTLARDAMSAARTPEQQIGTFLGSGDIWAIQVRNRDVAMRSFHVDAPICAFVGLIDRDPACLRFAARIAICLAHTTNWAPHFMQSFPGSTWDTRAFPEAFTTAGAALALDWAGGWFTPEGEHLVRYAIATKGLPRVREVFLQYEYMWSCNQHHMISLGRILGLLVLQKAWPRTTADIDIFERDLREIIDLYIQPDGSTQEGVGYWSNSFRASLPAFAALARFRGQPLPDMVPPKLRSMDSYVGALLSTAGEPGSYLPIADTVGDAVAVDALAMMAHAAPSPLWTGLIADSLRRGKRVKRDWAFDGFFAVIYGPAQIRDERITLPAFTKLAKAGMVSSFRRLEGEGVRLFLVGAMENAGHCHRDKGSFLLEVGGEAFAIDRGAVPYEDATNLPFMKSEVAHNLAVPEGCGQQNPSPVASDWEAAGDELFLRATVDTGKTWLPPVVSCRRTIHSVSPGEVEIVDEFELTEPRTVTFFLHSPLPMHLTGHQAEVRGTHFNMAVDADWASTASANPCGVNWCYTPINRLALVSTPARHHRLTTRLRFKRNQAAGER